MSHGGGKYEKESTIFRSLCGALGVVTMVFAGKRGHGFEVQLPSPKVARFLPAKLREIADQIEKDMETSPPEGWEKKDGPDPRKRS